MPDGIQSNLGVLTAAELAEQRRLVQFFNYPWPMGPVIKKGASEMDETEVIMQEFAAFAVEHGLMRFPDPDGERYVYRTDQSCDGKKVECTDLIDELWNALARSHGREDLCVPVER